MPSIDVVSEVDLQEVRNAVDQATREVTTRYDFKGTETEVRLTDDGIVLESSSEGRLEAAQVVLKEKLVRRQVSLKSLSGGIPQEVGGARFRSVFSLNQGIDQDSARELAKRVRNMKLKVQAQVHGDRVRISGNKRDDLQQVIAELKSLDHKLPLQYINFRD
ncbi:MAG: YajQ family cyclic di-GMP-binding protein [Acidimicrobiia bacterium]|nr:YajQ family cyclic di-GMP-binding protein [Acidimicrobiia bacterium]